MKGTAAGSPGSKVRREVGISLSAKSPITIENLLTDLSQRKKQNVFFNDSFTIEELHKLGNVKPIQEVDESDSEARRLPCTSSGKAPLRTFTLNADNLSKSTALLQGPQPAAVKVEPKKRVLWADFSSDSSCTPTPRPLKAHNITLEALSEAIKPAPVILLEPPKKKALHKRMERCQYEVEQVVETRQKAALKFYNLKKRFGFITLIEDSSDIFLCEDDVLLSGQNFKQFKEAVAKRRPISLLCDVISYENKGITKRKAVNIEVHIGD
jgi:hypothetical protein